MGIQPIDAIFQMYAGIFLFPPPAAGAFRKKRSNSPDGDFYVIPQVPQSERFNFFNGVTEPSIGAQSRGELRLEKFGPGIGAVGGEYELVQLRAMETAAFWESWDREIIRGAGAVGEIQPERDVGQSTISTAGSEIENRDVKASRDGNRPTKE